MGYPVINQIQAVPEIEVKFQTYNRTDAQTYRGTIMGCVNFDVARMMCGDVIAQHNNMEPRIARKEVAIETFILVKTQDGAVRPFAVSWIKEPTFERTDDTADVKIVIRNIQTKNLYQILTYIKEAGFECAQI